MTIASLLALVFSYVPIATQLVVEGHEMTSGLVYDEGLGFDAGTRAVVESVDADHVHVLALSVPTTMKPSLFWLVSR
jgi:hypothetical protein